MAEYPIGHHLTPAKVDAFWRDDSDVSGTVLVDFHEQSRPGFAAQLPFFVTRLIRLNDGRVFEEFPWEPWGQNFAQLVYRGTNLSDVELIDLLVALVIRRDFQVSVAAHFHFDAERFGEHAENMKSVRAGFWSVWDPSFTEVMQLEVDTRLRKTNRTYQLFCELFESPMESKFRGILESAIDDGNFGLAHELGAK